MFKVSHLGLLAAIVAAAGWAGQARAATYDVSTLNATGNSGFTYDTDSTAPAVTSNGFFAVGTTGQYQTLRITPDAIGLTGLTLGDITNITYDTQQLGGAIDWQVMVYTAPAGDGSKWYGVRLKYGLNAGTDHDWTTYTVDGATYNDWITDGSTSGYTLAYTYLLQNEPANYNGLLAAAAGQQVLWIDISAGAASGGRDFDTYLNNIDFNTTLGDATVVAAPAPEPASLCLLGLGAVGLLARRRRHA